MPATTQQQFREILDDAWKCDYADAAECHHCEQLIARIQNLWDRDHQFFASAIPSPQNREEAREVAKVLRMAERAMTMILKVAAKSVAKGYMVNGLDWLIPSIYEARKLIVLPIARRMAARDIEGRDPHKIAHQLVSEVRFEDGRAIITEKMAEGFPNPFEAEPVA